MIEGGRRSGLAQDPCSTVACLGDVRTEKLERDPPIESRILGDLHVSHAAASELVQHQVMTESGADRMA